jgi:hypothetical protein
MKAYLWVLGVLILGSCSGLKSIPVSEDALRAHQGQALTIVGYAKPDFRATTQQVVLTASLFLGSAAAVAYMPIAIDKGNRLVRENSIPDPALAVSAKLVPMLQERLKPSSTKTFADVGPKANDESSVSRLADNNGVVADVQTLDWQLTFFPFSAHYSVFVVIRVRLLDARTTAVLAQARCLYHSPKDGAPTYDQMVDDHATLLKSMLVTATTSCSATIQNELFGNGTAS